MVDGVRRRRLRTAVIGAGFVGPFHVDAVRRGGYADVAVLADSAAASVRRKAEALHIARWTTDVAAVLGDRTIDVVHICTPNATHAEYGLSALDAGHHVVMEKPLALDTEDAARLVGAASRAGCHAAVSFTYRGYPMVRQARAMVGGGQIGELRLVHGWYLQDWLLEPDDWNWRVDPRQGSSRAVADIGSHWFDLLEYIGGHRVTAVFADFATVVPERNRPQGEVEAFGASREAATRVRVETEDAAVLAFRLEGNGRATCLISQVSPGRRNAIMVEFAGSVRSLGWNQERPETLWVGARGEAGRILTREPAMGDVAAGVPSLPSGHPEGWAEALRDLLRPFYAAVASGEPPPSELIAPYPTFQDGARAVVFVASALKSSRTGAWVELRAG
jgi:predicted dehydrogenase